MLKRAFGALLLPMLLVACDLTTNPFQLQLQFFDDYQQVEGGCAVTFHAVAVGNGHAEWERFTHLIDTQVVRTYTATEFWGATRINAGEEQSSITLQQPDTTGRYHVLMEFRTGNNQRELLFSSDCPTGTT
jgi:hypothetical protein